MKNILITDSLFIFPEHEQKLKDAGFNVERLDKPKATEDELIEALKDKQGYILGGIERVTEKVLNSTDALEAIAFTGSDHRGFIPAHELATKKGIAISNCPGGVSPAVAEYTLTLMLAMTRDIFDLGRTGGVKFKTTKSLAGSTVGIIGMGHIPQLLIPMLQACGVAKILYWSRTRKPDIEKSMGIIWSELEPMLQESDVVTLHASKEAGENYFTKDMLARMKEGALLINCSFGRAVDQVALYDELSTGRLRAASDDPMGDVKFKDLPLHTFFCSNGQTAFNTFSAIQKVSDMATQSIINLLSTGKDEYRVN